MHVNLPLLSLTHFATPGRANNGGLYKSACPELDSDSLGESDTHREKLLLNRLFKIRKR